MAWITDNNGDKVRVSISAIADELKGVTNLTELEWMEWYDEDDYKHENVTYDENGNISDETLKNCAYPVRLQVVNGDYLIHCGSEQFDTDPRGSWGYGYLFYKMTKAQYKEAARELIEDCE